MNQKLISVQISISDGLDKHSQGWGLLSDIVQVQLDADSAIAKPIILKCCNHFVTRKM